MDDGRSSRRHPATPPFPVCFALERVDPKITEFQWPKGKESRVPYWLKEPDSKLMTAANLVRSNLANRMSCLALACIQTDILYALAPAAPGLHKDDLTGVVVVSVRDFLELL